MRLTLSLIVLCLTTTVLAQSDPPALQLDADYDAERLVREVFASDNCETIFNIRPIGINGAGIGFFTGPEDIVGFDRGIILSTGNIEDAAGPNNSTITTTDLSGPSPDPDLDLASTGTIHDRSGIEFDFIPLQSTVTFRYVFASEEYCDFVGAQFNDIFGFFISGPGIDGPFDDGAINLARVPGTNLPVTVNTVNFSNNAQFYLDNELPSVRRAAGCGGEDQPGPRFASIEYDGQTVILTATVDLQPCEIYHIRLLVGDVQDADLDSAVFLEAGSFDLGGSVSLERNDGGTGGALTVFEGCAPTAFRVQRGEDSNPARPQVIDYRIGDASTATEGTDFTAGTGRVTIPAGSDFIDIPISAPADGRQEGAETAWVVLDIPCACYTDSIEIIIDEPDELVVGLEEAYYCPDETATLRPNIQGGAPPFTYSWSFGSTEAEPTLPPPLPPSISLSVTDACGQTTSRNIATFSSEPPSISFPAQDLTSCWNESQRMVADLTGNPPFEITFQVNGGQLETVVIDEAGRQSWPIERGGNYSFLSIRDAGCQINVDESLRADFYRPVINARVQNPTCAGTNDGSFFVSHLSTLPPYRYDWSGIQPDSLAATRLAPGAYGLTVTDALGCQDTAVLDLIAPDSLRPVEITCSEIRRPPLRLSASGGRPPYQYSIDGERYFLSRDFSQLETGAFYQLRIRDSEGCEIIQPNFFLPEAVPRSARLPTFIPQEIAGSVEVRPDYLVPNDQIAAFRWSPAEFFDCASCPNPTLSAPNSQPISLAVENIYGCVDSLVTFVAVDGRVPLFVPNVFSPNGDGTNDVVAVFGNNEQVERVISFRIYTRWGELVWEDFDFAPNSARRGWNGNFNGLPSPPSAYAWVAEIRLTTGEVQREAGTTILLRD